MIAVPPENRSLPPGMVFAVTPTGLPMFFLSIRAASLRSGVAAFALHKPRSATALLRRASSTAAGPSAMPPALAGVTAYATVAAARGWRVEHTPNPLAAGAGAPYPWGPDDASEAVVTLEVG